jgi:hypothetical protein
MPEAKHNIPLGQLAKRLNLKQKRVPARDTLTISTFATTSLFRGGSDTRLKFLARQSASPGGSQERQQIAVHTVEASNAPAQDQEQCQEANDRVDADRTGEHEVQVHEYPEEGGNTGQDAEDQGQANQDFTKGDDVCEDSGVW